MSDRNRSKASREIAALLSQAIDRLRRRLAHDELVFGRPAGVVTGVDDQGAVVGQLAFFAVEGQMMERSAVVVSPEDGGRFQDPVEPGRTTSTRLHLVQHVHRVALCLEFVGAMQQNSPQTRCEHDQAQDNCSDRAESALRCLNKGLV